MFEVPMRCCCWTFSMGFQDLIWFVVFFGEIFSSRIFESFLIFKSYSEIPNVYIWSPLRHALVLPINLSVLQKTFNRCHCRYRHHRHRRRHYHHFLHHPYAYASFSLLILSGHRAFFYLYAISSSHFDGSFHWLALMNVHCHLRRHASFCGSSTRIVRSRQRASQAYLFLGRFGSGVGDLRRPVSPNLGSRRPPWPPRTSYRAMCLRFPAWWGSRWGTTSSA